jgi:hypothetical protein
MRRPPFTPQEDSWYSFLLEAELPVNLSGENNEIANMKEGKQTKTKRQEHYFSPSTTA